MFVRSLDGLPVLLAISLVISLLALSTILSSLPHFSPTWLGSAFVNLYIASSEVQIRCGAARQ